ncbi:INO80 complex subunit B [Spea bombifrons]|uniref:INO80 complex subunit B n=1 Tax=Spea bombifrons TaxID=233779 RepID=UPI00234B780C|nr:INO80 complex subunit B [Spea bombifrons]
MSNSWKRKAMEGTGDEDDVTVHGIHKKKHKKHKKHKKKHHQEVPGPAQPPDGPAKPQHNFPEGPTKPQHKPPDSPAKPQLKLKIKLGGQVLGTKSVPTFTVIPELSPVPMLAVDDEEEPLEGVEGVPIEQYRAWLDEDSNLDPLPSAGAEQDEESRWLEALERGELDVNGDLKRETDESLLTARQKALLQKQQMQALPVFAPAVYPLPPQELSEEMLVKREEKARKRRLQAAKKAEESKKQTIERLTKTSKSRGVKTPRERRARQPPCPTVRYQNTAGAITISYPTGVPAPTPLEPRPALPAPTLCAVPGCVNIKKYCCSETFVPLCSLECYRRRRAAAEEVERGAAAPEIFPQ